MATMGVDPTLQQIHSTTRTAVGQCLTCGAFTLTGDPPVVHRTGCVGGPDGSQVDGDTPSLTSADGSQHA
jgi:hypothetical protein